jgi:hypothetical protein
MLIRMVHVRPSLGPIPQPRQPRTLIRVPCDGPHALGAICRSIILMPRWPGHDAQRAALAPAETRPRVRSATWPRPPRPCLARPPSRTCSDTGGEALHSATASSAGSYTRDSMPGCQPPRPRGEAARGHVACCRHRDLPGHSRTHARRFGTATIHAGFGWAALSACFETRASACCALTAYAPFRALSPVTGRFVCFETPPAGAETLIVGSGSCPARPCATLRRWLPTSPKPRLRIVYSHSFIAT